MNHFKSVKIAYIGGGSRGWAWGLMSDLILHGEGMEGQVSLYDIDRQAALNNQQIANNIPENPFRYTARDTIGEALEGADFVVISILPGTFDEMESDVHGPEAYGIYQPVGDTTGPGGIVRAVRTIPMFVEIAQAIEKYCPEAWVINYTNPMSMCVDTLYRTFPKIKAFGCCHEVFGTQKLLARSLLEMEGEPLPPREEIKVNVQGINHFTWIDQASFHGKDLFPIFQKFCEKYHETGYIDPTDQKHWANGEYKKKEMVKMDLFLRYGVIGAAGDRHLSEFCPGQWYLGSPENVARWGFGLTSVASRREGLQRRLEKSRRMLAGEPFELKQTGEEGVRQMRALLGLEDLVTNVNLPNIGQLPDLPLGCVVETNAVFTSNHVRPVCGGKIQPQVLALIQRTACNQISVVEGCLNRDLNRVFQAFSNDPLVTIPVAQARNLFDQMLAHNSKYHQFYI